MVTKEEVEAEHLAALASLTHEQRSALHRNRVALQIGNFSHQGLKHILLDQFQREARYRSVDARSLTAADIEHEHRAALADLNREQRRALHRVERALQRSNFSLHSLKELLLETFEREAAEAGP